MNFLKVEYREHNLRYTSARSEFRVSLFTNTIVVLDVAYDRLVFMSIKQRKDLDEISFCIDETWRNNVQFNFKIVYRFTCSIVFYHNFLFSNLDMGLEIQLSFKHFSFNAWFCSNVEKVAKNRRGYFSSNVENLLSTLGVFS